MSARSDSSPPPDADEDPRDAIDTPRPESFSTLLRKTTNTRKVSLAVSVTTMPLLMATALLTGHRITLQLSIIAGASAIVCYATTYALLTPFQVWRDRTARRMGSICLGAYIVAGAYFYWYAQNRRIESDFYATVAQVLPALVLATIFSDRNRRTTTESELTFYVGVVACGEFASLFGLAFDIEEDAYLFGSSCGSMVAAFTGLLVTLYSSARPTVAPEPGSDRKVTEGVDERAE